MRAYIIAAIAAFSLAPAAALAGCGGGAVTCNAGANYAQQYGHAPQAYAAPAQPAYAAQAYNASYDDEVVTYGQRTRKRQSYYFNPRDYRSFKCRTKHSSQQCSFEFRGDNADDVEFYLSQALIASAGHPDTQAQCYQTRRSAQVTCAIRGDLRYMDANALRYALYGR